MEIKPYTICAGICLSCAVVAGGFGVAKNQASVNANAARTEALRQINNYRIANNCWSIEPQTHLTIGTEIILSSDGKSPTLCFHDATRQTYAYTAYLKGRLQVLYTFTLTEVKKGVPNNG